MLTQLALYTYQLPLNLSSFPYSSKCGIILESPEYGMFSEAAPLIGFSKESTKDALTQLTAILHSFLVRFNERCSEESAFSFLREAHLYPSVTFALYSLLEQIYFPIPHPTLVSLRAYVDIPYQNPSSSTLLLQHLLTLSSAEVIKIKLGSYPVDEAKEVLLTVLKSSSAALHLDINQKWSLDDALTFSSYFQEGSFASLEDPVSNPSDLWYFAKHSPHPIALDHLLRTHTLYDFLTLPHLYSYEFKPMLDMHLLLNPLLLKLLRTFNIKITLSSSYETGIGIAAIGRLGLKLRSSYLGIDTLGVFAEDLLLTPLERLNNHFMLPRSLNPNKKLLTLYETASLSHC